MTSPDPQATPPVPRADDAPAPRADTPHAAGLPDDDALAALLADWLPQQRWFAGRAGEPATVRLASRGELSGPGLLPGVQSQGPVEFVLADTATGVGTGRYQVIVGWTSELPDRLAHSVIGWSNEMAAYDALHDQATSSLLLAALATGADLGGLRAEAEPDADIDATAHGLVISAEQSNTSIVYGDSVILKVYRRIEPGENPDLEVHQALHAAGSRHIADPVGALVGTIEDTDTTLGMATRFFANSAEGWAMATASIRDLMAEGDLHADEVGGDFAAEAERLGEAIAEVHGDLAATLGRSSWSADQVATVLAAMAAEAETTAAAVPALAEHLDAVRSVFATAAGLGVELPVQRIHGDLHLGQVLRTVTGWVVIDFEGEPSRPLAERRELRSPLQDVAGMLRSFDYAAHQLALTGHADAQHVYRAGEWSRRNRGAFCQGYAAVTGSDPRDTGSLLRAFELSKAVYEVGYEHGHRPAWEQIPLGAVAELVKEHR
jgi:maltokinase